MKALLIITIFILFVGCGNQTSADGIGNNSINNKVQVSPTIDDANANFRTIPYEYEKVDKARLEELEIQNEKFRTVPDEFKNIDFTNFSYPYQFSYNKRKINVNLIEGEYEYQLENRDGWGWFSLSDAFFIDLNNDDIKEAVVILWHVSCGGSCDGGSGLFYVYSNVKKKPRLIWQHKIGSFAYGCGLKSFTIKNKKIILEQFGRCKKNASKNEDDSYPCKFCVKDQTKTIYSMKGSSILKESAEVIETPVTNVMNYSSEISIND